MGNIEMKRNDFSRKNDELKQVRQTFLAINILLCPNAKKRSAVSLISGFYCRFTLQ